MSLEEKVNQMSQVTGGFFIGEIVVTGPMADKGFTEDNVNLAGSVIGSMGAETLKSIQKNYMEKHPHHIPLLFMLDVINGYKTVFPIPLAQGASFEPELSEQCASVAAKEASVSGLHVTFAPSNFICSLKMSRINFLFPVAGIPLTVLKDVITRAAPASIPA